MEKESEEKVKDREIERKNQKREDKKIRGKPIKRRIERKRTFQTPIL